MRGKFLSFLNKKKTDFPFIDPTKPMLFKKLNPLLHNELRLSLVSYLVTKTTARFSELKEVTHASAGNLSVQIKKLEEERYFTVHKSFENNYPRTDITITQEGIEAFKEYQSALKSYF